MAGKLSLYARSLRQCAQCHILFEPRGWDTNDPDPATECRDCVARPIMMAMQYYWGCSIAKPEDYRKS